MKIAVVSTYAPKGMRHSNAGGVASYTKNLVSNFQKNADDQFFVFCDRIDHKSDRYEEDGLTVLRCFDKNLKCFFQLFKEIKVVKPDVVHIHQELALFGGIVNAYLLQWFIFFLRARPVVITLHGVVSLQKIDKDFIRGNNSNLPVWLTKFAFYVIYKPLCIWSSKVIVHEECFRQILIKEYGVSGQKIVVIPHGVERLDRIDRAVARERLRISESKHVVLFVGYLTGYKGIDLLIEGFADYAKKDPDAFLVIGAGEHPKLKNDLKYKEEYQRLMEKARSMISKDQYQWFGFIEEKDIQTQYSACDVSIFPYLIHLSSSGPMAISIGYGVPFLASDVFSEFVHDESLCFERTSASMSDRLDDFFHRGLAERVNFKEMRERLLWDAIAQKHIDVFRTYDKKA